MPSTYVSFIKAGKLYIPIELYFLSSSNDAKSPSNWAETKHWNDIKDVLKPAVELGLKTHNEFDKTWIPREPRIEYKDDIILGHVFVANDKNKFTDLLDRRPTVTDKDDQVLDDHSGLKDFGGQFKKYSPTKLYIKACALLRNGNDLEDEKTLLKELGLKLETYRTHSFFQPLVAKKNSPSPSSSSSL